MTTPQQTLAEIVFRNVRDIYYKDRSMVNKSSNKTYNVARIGADKQAWAVNRNAVAQTAATQITAYRADPAYKNKTMIELGDQLVHWAQAGTYRSTNCYELTALCCAFAANRYHASANVIYWASLVAPGDHISALFGPLASMCIMEKQAIVDYKRLKFPAGDIPWVADVWMNICCNVNEYPNLAAEKLNKWQNDAKQLYWTGADGKTPGSYPAGGDYKIAFLRSIAVVGQSDTK